MNIKISRDELIKKKGKISLDSIISENYNIVVNKDRIASAILSIKKQIIKENKNGTNNNFNN
jgi:hypothetical protein